VRRVPVVFPNLKMDRDGCRAELDVAGCRLVRHQDTTVIEIRAGLTPSNARLSGARSASAEAGSWAALSHGAISLQPA
jgi:hypothetical protein